MFVITEDCEILIEGADEKWVGGHSTLRTLTQTIC